jgi:hypothetical protein
MPEYPIDDFLTEQELCAASGMDRYALRRIRRWLFINPLRTFGRGKGSLSYYPRSVVPMFRRFHEVLSQTRSADQSFWTIWLEDFPVEIGKWADARLAEFEKLFGKLASADELDTAIDAISRTKPSRTSLRSSISSRLRLKEEFSLLRWAAAVAAGAAPPKSLYDPVSPPFDALKQSAGLSGDWGAPDAELRIESFDLRRMRDVLREATPAEMEQARDDCKVVEELAEASKAIDWFAVRKALNMQRTSSGQPPAPVYFFVKQWRDFSARAVVLSFLIYVRRLPDYSHKVSEILAVARTVLQGFPRKPGKGTRQELAANSTATEVQSQDLPDKGT